VLLEAPIHPGKESVYGRLAMCQSMQLFAFARQVKPSDLVLDRVERTDLSERLKYARRVCALGINKLSTRMAP
jgi:hypothetical protein